MSLVWNREPYSPKRQAMSVERVVRTAIGIADAEGLDALSMRRVAAELKSGTTSLYRYVANRDELLDLMADAVWGEDPPQEVSGDWRADLAEVARRQRSTLLRHGWLGALMTSRPSLGPNSLRRFDAALRAAGALTPDITRASAVMALISDYVLGAVARELAEQEASRRTGMTEQEWRASIAPYIREVVASGDYPEFARSVVEADDLDFTDQFEFGLRCLLRGVEETG
ncbi:TetR/AcrR family transcriptional regulator [Nonomuraea sp. NEAU-A123]|uniref:TetR/AcrR family transcriptional regulator n=1 Tax=Nonomuraea sp. NEAU-A123 TaxID=2839649 RepID=UPI001BE451DA|nr:TetR/AcrR family transcriptional regulator C-terminal domain-containing protein [Nonomuraea sp. NEAU-A123]MBT2226663.1 TetR/AcrR family transcriptional regulator C-terminal domain-containing protein [Nonomuraea sp. NEAU-A123]